jgi:hypothetical protein
MVTINQFSRGVGRTLRAMERNAQRAQRQQLAHQKAMARIAMLEAAADAAEAYDALLDNLTGSHRAAFSRMDWVMTAAAPVPEDPSPHRPS